MAQKGKKPQLSQGQKHVMFGLDTFWAKQIIYYLWIYPHYTLKLTDISYNVHILSFDTAPNKKIQ